MYTPPPTIKAAVQQAIAAIAHAHSEALVLDLFATIVTIE
jgi:hypothetical protein